MPLATRSGDYGPHFQHFDYDRPEGYAIMATFDRAICQNRGHYVDFREVSPMLIALLRQSQWG